MRADELAKNGADIYWTQARTWPVVQRGQASNQGLDEEETHRVLKV